MRELRGTPCSGVFSAGCAVFKKHIRVFFVNSVSENEYIVSAINYSPLEQNPNLRIKDGMKYEMLYGNFDTIPANDTIVLKVVAK